MNMTLTENTKNVTFNLDKNQIIIYKKYIQKHKYKTKKNIIYSYLYKNINDSNWYKYLPKPNIKEFYYKIGFSQSSLSNIGENMIVIRYKINKWNCICLTIENNFQKPEFFSQFYQSIDFNIVNFRLLIINYIRLLCFNNNIY